MFIDQHHSHFIAARQQVIHSYAGIVVALYPIELGLQHTDGERLFLQSRIVEIEAA